VALFNGIVLGQYIPVESAIHRLDPRTKILSTLGLLAALFAVRGFAGLGALTLFLLLAALAARVGPRYLLRGLRPLVWLLLFAVAMQVLGGESGGHVLARVGPVAVTRENLSRAAFYGWRLVLLVLATTLMTLVTSPMEFTDGLERILRPLRRVGVSAHDLAMMMTIALRFIPTLLEEAEVIMKAQMARGAEFTRGSIASRARSLIPLLVPLFVGAFRRADQLAIAMEARCYRGGAGRTRMRVLRLGPRDAVAFAVLAAVAAAAVLGPGGLPGAPP
jgi:energy-coupling factor transport system permease protein